MCLNGFFILLQSRNISKIKRRARITPGAALAFHFGFFFAMFERARLRPINSSDL
ncbi:MAG: hypothetical protein U0U46_16230 [Saprospiraceae bacterium]